MIKELENKIKEKLESINEIKQVFDFYKFDFDWFPYAWLELVEIKWKKLDTCSNIRTYTFWILVFQETSSIWRKKAKEIIYNIFDKIILAFDSDETLNWLAVSSEITKLKMSDWPDDKKWNWLYWTATININSLLCFD